MIKVLIIIAVSGLLLATVCISGAVALGGRDIVWGAWDPSELKIFGPNVSGPRSSEYDDGRAYGFFYEGPTETRDYPWSGAGEIDVGMPADVTYIQGPSPKITVTAPTAALNRFSAEAGNLRLRGWSAETTFTGIPTKNDMNPKNRPPRLQITVTAPGVTRFSLSGSETLVIDAYNQDTLELKLSGISKVSGKGKARLLKLDLSGAASADLGQFALNEADADLSGASHAAIAPKDRADLDMSGASRLALLVKPTTLEQDLSGGASVDLPGGAALASSQMPPAKAGR